MSLINTKSKISAAILSYVLLILNTLASLFLTPFLLKELGVDEFGLYQMVYSVAHYIIILDLGIGTVMIRYIAEYRAKNDVRGEANFASLMLMICTGLAFAIGVVGVILNINLENIFQNLTTSDYNKSHEMFVIMIVQFILTLFIHFFSGVIKAYERFTFTTVLGIVKLVVSFTLTIALIYAGMGCVGIVIANTIALLCELFVELFVVFRRLRFKIHFYNFNKQIIVGAFGLMMAMLLQSVVNHVNSSVDKTILGIMTTKTDVAVYSIAATIITLFNTIPTMISTLFQPQVIKIIVKNDNKTVLSDLVIRVGRWQLALAGGIMCGLVVFGKDFITLWAGKEVSTAWLITIIVMPFNLIPLIQNVCISILNGYDKRLDRSLILAGMTIFNIIITVLLIKWIGPIGAPVGTAISFLLGHGLCLNCYYKKVIKLEVGRMFRSTFRGILPCLIVATLVTSPMMLYSNYSWVALILKGIIFCTVLLALLLKFGLNDEEMDLIKHMLCKFNIIKHKKLNVN